MTSLHQSPIPTGPPLLRRALPDPALAISYDEARRYVQLRLRQLPHGALRAIFTALGLPYTASVGLKTGSLQREEYRLVQRHLRAFGFDSELVRLLTPDGTLGEHYLLPSAPLLAELRVPLGTGVPAR